MMTKLSLIILAGTMKSLQIRESRALLTDELVTFLHDGQRLCRSKSWWPTKPFSEVKFYQRFFLKLLRGQEILWAMQPTLRQSNLVSLKGLDENLHAVTPFNSIPIETIYSWSLVCSGVINLSLVAKVANSTARYPKQKTIRPILWSSRLEEYGYCTPLQANLENEKPTQCWCSGCSDCHVDSQCPTRYSIQAMRTIKRPRNPVQSKSEQLEEP